MSHHAVPRQRSKSVSYVHSSAPPPYAQVKADPYHTGYVPAGLPSWAPAPAPYPQYPAYHAPQPAVAPQPQGYGYFSWPSTSTVDKIPDEHKRSRTPAPGKKGGLFSSLRRKVTGPETHLHMLLLHARPSPLLYDVRNAPQTATHGNRPLQPLAPSDRLQPATSPARSFLRITCELMPWTLEISRPHGQGVTVGDVLDELHALLHKRVRRSEWLIAGDALQERVVRTFAWRCYNSPAPRGVEEQLGPRRVDWLLKRTVFRGLSHGPDDETFVLHLGQH